MSTDNLSVLGIDLDELEWQDLALCDDTMPTNMFYDDYESDAQVANVVDQACLSCPVMAQCLQRGIENSEWGVWGGIYLTSGKPDMSKNDHKSQDTWGRIKERIGAESLH